MRLVKFMARAIIKVNDNLLTDDNKLPEYDADRKMTKEFLDLIFSTREPIIIWY